MENTNMMERHERTPHPEPVAETQESVSYLGVRLHKAENQSGPFVPDRNNYQDYINDEFALEVQKQLAVAFSMGQPILVEGGTEIGKTTTARKMAAELGWEVHYANLNYGADETKLMGKPLPNTERTSPEDPEYVYWLGKISAGLVPEEGKIKLIIIDEVGAAMPENLIMLHEVLDAIGRGEPVDLSEFGNGIVQVDPTKIKIAAFTNPPGKGYVGRKIIDPALIRRFVYWKAPSELPDAAFSNATDAVFGLAPMTAEIPEESFLYSRETALLPEQLQEIPGIETILGRYKEFHKAAKELVKNRRVAADQPQPFSYGDRTEPKRVRDFILQFYNGDINQTIQTALRYFYSNKLESVEDKAKLDELIQHVEYIAPQNVSARRGADRNATAPVAETRAPIDSDVIRGEIQGWRNVLGTEVDIQPLPASITPEVRRNLERMGMELRFIPSVDLGTLDELKRKGQEQFLTDLQRKYPKWRRYESLSDTEREDHSVTRNLEQWFWELAKEDRMDFPSLPGNWVAIETMPKPSYGEHYAPSKVGEKLGFEDRFNVTWNDANEAINRQKRDILSEAGLRSGDVRMLNAVEWNLLANREGWGQTNTYEWTNTEARGDGGSLRVIVGLSDNGGAAYAYWRSPERSLGDIGFRVAVVLGP